MSYNSFSNNTITTQANDSFRTSTHCYRLRFFGLRPRTKHKMYLDGQEFTWACKGFGQNLGEDLLSDVDGNLTVYVFYENHFSRPAEFENRETQSVAYYSNRLNNQNNRMEDAVVVQWKEFQVRSVDGLSHASVNIHFHIVLINGDVNRIEQHD